MRILLLVPIGLVLLGLAVWAFVWTVRRGQFDDLDTPALDILTNDDDTPRRSTILSSSSTSPSTSLRTPDAD
ncbi:cbb3-type cytochrome oxidase assembly protein CcoS [Luteimonas kalidii]|uniref:Cbb3-type cytochrome oxidase assembly protein CcoS n=1 Tax=Luteimonas kalidii TaxID=3042025 RepID=A0ABT6JTV5_9GAMM|nr:cbb3-type cytochrome oxidase assembly protein CcoS [Luteimonas kalidii]MDH5834128.1 cbb3-type cytochrome oxidase assembly protein CcoS [Luteimonas kalidii]